MLLKNLLAQQCAAQLTWFTFLPAGRSCDSHNISPENRVNIHEFNCNKCSTYEARLKEALDELGSAQLNINILQKELTASTTTMNSQDNNPASTEEFITCNPRRKKRSPHNGEKDNVQSTQHFQPIPVVVNRYAALDNLQESVKVSHNLNKSGEVASTWNRNKSLTKTKKKKIVIIGNSHARDYAAELSSDLGQDFEVTGTVIPRARLEIITNLAVEEISSLEKSDAVIVIGGTNDINKNESNIGLTHLKKFVENRRNTNIMVVAPPHRYDLHESSCVNKEIVVFN